MAPPAEEKKVEAPPTEKPAFTRNHHLKIVPSFDANVKLTGGKLDPQSAELRGFVLSVLSTKMDEIKTALNSKLAQQEEMIQSKLKKVDVPADDDKKNQGKKGKK